MTNEELNYSVVVSSLIDKFQDQITDEDKLGVVIEALCYLLAHAGMQVDTDIQTFLADVHNTVYEHTLDMKKEFIQ